MGDEHTRRRFLALLPAAGLAGLAGCSEGDPEPRLHAIGSHVVYNPDTDWIDYPTDVGVELEIQNTANERRTGELVVELRRIDETGESATVTDTWTKRRPVNLGRGKAVAGIKITFDDVAERDQSDVSWETEVWIETGEDAETPASTPAGTPIS